MTTFSFTGLYWMATGSGLTNRRRLDLLLMLDMDFEDDILLEVLILFEELMDLEELILFEVDILDDLDADVDLEELMLFEELMDLDELMLILFCRFGKAGESYN
ncbi:expressed unknown protein [Seminavis robusta]|uniref:Uncharacterized protein n=1 Tax=Seminavis robusta TaxID=568900 RepID=A0A9N8EKE2_9STRA|nr:expressed unknown protein [Seminavis robusta]|eukprot:Sro1222_g253830.1 n/a (104) ;mRNA; f:23562-23873